MMLSAWMTGGYGISPPVVGVISYIDSAFGSYVSSGTSSSVTIPAATAEDDLLVAMVLHRSALTAPPGWTLVSTLSVVGGGTTQYTSMLHRVASGSDASTTLTMTQSGSVRMHTSVAVFRNTGAPGSYSLTSATGTSGGTAVIQPHPVASIAGQDDSVGISYLNITQAVAGGSFTIITAPSGMTLRSTASLPENRAAFATIPLSSSGSISGGWGTGVSTANWYNTISLVVAP